MSGKAPWTKERSLKFGSNGDGKAELVQGRETLGRRVEATVLGLGDEPIPEDITLHIPVYDDLRMGKSHRVTFELRCSLETSVADQRFRVTPVAGAIQGVVAQADYMLLERLRLGLSDLGEDVKVFSGAR